jgi:hypothetical protein
MKRFSVNPRGATLVRSAIYTAGLNQTGEFKDSRKCDSYRLKKVIANAGGNLYELYLDENSDERFIIIPLQHIFVDSAGQPIDVSINPIAECQLPSMMGSPMVNTMTNGMANTMVAETKSDVATSTTPSVLNWKTFAIVGGIIAVGYYLIKKKIIKIK